MMPITARAPCRHPPDLSICAFLWGVCPRDFREWLAERNAGAPVLGLEASAGRSVVPASELGKRRARFGEIARAIGRDAAQPQILPLERGMPKPHRGPALERR